MDMVKFARKQSSKIDLAGIYYQRELTFSIILKHKLGNKQMYHILYFAIHTAQKIKFSIKNFFSKCDQIRSFLRIWSHLLKKSLTANVIFCTVHCQEQRTYTQLILSCTYLGRHNLFLAWDAKLLIFSLIYTYVVHVLLKLWH